MKKSIYRIISTILGLLHLVVFLLIPYAKLDGLMGSIGQLAGAFGMGDAYPEKLTGLKAIGMLDTFGLAGFFGFVFLIPVVLGLCIALMMFLGKGKASYITTLVLSIVLGIPFYAVLNLVVVGVAISCGYSAGIAAWVGIGLFVVQFIMCIVGLCKDKGGAAAPKASGKNVKVGKKDGTITGVSGSYAGAVIPVKSGDTVIIGRDPSVCSIVVKDEKASRKHCIIAYNGDNGMYAVTDFSVNGVFDRDGNRIPEKVAVPMSAGSEIRIGKDGDVFRLG